MTPTAFEAPPRIARMRAQNAAPGPQLRHAGGLRGLLPKPETRT